MLTRLLKLVIRCSYWSGLFHAFLLLEDKFGWRRLAVCLCCHNIESVQRTDAISEIEKGTLATDLDAQLNVFSRWLAPVDDQGLADWLEKKSPLDNDSLLVTFDDGYQDNLTVAGPILSRLGAQSLIFIATGYVESEQRFWWIRLSAALRYISAESWCNLRGVVVEPKFAEVLNSENLSSWESRVRARRKLATLIESTGEFENLLTELESVGEDFNDDSMPILTWNEMREMLNQGFAFGGHTLSHPRLDLIGASRVNSEVSSCKETIDKELQQSTASFAYPYGAYNQDAVMAVQQANYRIAFTTNPGIVTLDSNPFELPRIFLSRTDRAELYCAMVVLKLSKYFPRQLAGLSLRLAD